MAIKVIMAVLSAAAVVVGGMQGYIRTGSNEKALLA
jgi:hypothetical protein